jgi:hypothetical protein
MCRKISSPLLGELEFSPYTVSLREIIPPVLEETASPAS